MAGRPQYLKDNDKVVARAFGRRLNLLRNNRELTLEQVGAVISVSHQEVSAYERGTRKPSLSVLIGLATYFDTSVDYLLGLEPLEKSLHSDDPRNRMTNFVKVS